MFAKRKSHGLEELDEPRPVVHSDGAGPWIQVEPPGTFVWRRVELPVDDLPGALEGMRLVHLSDLHLHRSWGGALDRLIADLAARPPDLILITGDFIDNRRKPLAALGLLERLMAGMASRLGTFAVLGNHDRNRLRPHLRRLNVSVLMRRRAIVDCGNGAAVELIGLPGSRRKNFDPEFVRRLPPRRPGRPRITLAHFPDLFQRVLCLDSDIYLAGHTHGGQVCLPGGRPLMRHDTFPRRWCQGVHRLGRTWHIVSRGMGMTGLRVRLFCPAEAMEITLRSNGRDAARSSGKR